MPPLNTTILAYSVLYVGFVPCDLQIGVECRFLDILYFS